MAPAVRRRLGDIFVERGLITDDQLGEALAEQRERGGKLGEILVELGFVTRVTLADAIAEHWDGLRATERERSAPARGSGVAPSGVGAVERLSVQLAERDAVIASQAATIASLVARLTELEGPSAA